ncbi:hypothetical protein Mapa_009573 [Marchantia paleacea]|nr:hypothetical protein Mapa_009573 [Marchantia paleacea]
MCLSPAVSIMSREDFRLLFVLWIAFGARQCVVHAVTSSFSIPEGSFSCGSAGNMLCAKDASTTADGLLKLTPDPPGRLENGTFYINTVGLALYKEPIQLLNITTNQSASFNISFSIRIEQGNSPGDGMAFVMYSDSDWVGGPGGSLGAFSGLEVQSGVNVLAVEFDTYKNFFDLDDNHVGIDVDIINSTRAKSVTSFRLVKAARVFGWVDYDSPTSNMELRISQTIQKPDQPFLTYTTDLTTVFHREQVWVGFSAANGNCFCFNYNTAYDLSLNSWFPHLSAAPDSDSAVQGSSSSNSTGEPINGFSISVGVIAGISVGSAAAGLGACFLAWCVLARRKKSVSSNSSTQGGGGGAADRDREFPMSGMSFTSKEFTYKDLSAATNDFNSALKLGKGGFGSVYRGQIPGTDQKVAVKRMDSTSRQGSRQFLAEVSTISQLRHRNIVQLLGWCSDGPESSKYLLVYELMPNGSLDKFLYSQAVEMVLSWEGRFKILGGLAAALHYLHEGWRHQVVHRDVKTSNIMLDDNFNAVLGDFGLARASSHSQSPPTTAVAGTHGYIAPEALLTGKYTAKTDVFAFGAVALEIVCGRKIYDANCPTDEIVLLDWVWEKLSEDNLLSVVDQRLVGEFDLEEVEVVLLLGLLCSHPVADERPFMNQVMGILAGTIDMPSIPKNKPESDYTVRLHRRSPVKLSLPRSPNGSVAQEATTGASDSLYTTSRSSIRRNPNSVSSSSTSSEIFIPRSKQRLHKYYVDASDHS